MLDSHLGEKKGLLRKDKCKIWVTRTLGKQIVASYQKESRGYHWSLDSYESKSCSSEKGKHCFEVHETENML